MSMPNLSLDTIVKYARRKGFVFQSSEIYGGFAATYDYGQLGTLLKKNLIDAWKYWMITSRTDVLEIEGAIFLHPKVWEASGHIGGFSDLMVDDLVTKKRYRADHLIEDAGVTDYSDQNAEFYTGFIIYQAKINQNKIWPLSIIEHFKKNADLFNLNSESIEADVHKTIKNLLLQDLLIVINQDKLEYLAKPELLDNKTIIDNAGGFTAEQADFVIKYYNLKSPDGNPLSTPKKFNLLVKTHLGPVEDDASLVYLKGEACQNIYVDWKQVQETSRKKLPFGIAQMGKAFRNEITVKQYMFRTREFEQIDLQFFVKPHTENEWFEFWKQYRYDFYTKYLGFSTESLKWHQHNKAELVFYATDAWDIYYGFGEMGFKELEGVHNRTDYDTRQHQTFSGTDLTYLDPETNEKYLPYIVEMSLGVNRLFLAALFEFYDEEKLEADDIRVVLRFPFDLAPYKIAVLPLMKKDGMGDKAQEIFASLRKAGIMADFDDAGSIGKRYRRQDENGTPWCVTVDYETLEEGHADFGTVTLRHRDTMIQTRVKIEEITSFVNKEKFGK
jgi:glycyl-tRNA synthetase